MEVDRNLLLISEIKEPTTQKDSLTWDSTRIAQLRKGRARTRVCSSGSKLTAPFTSLSESSTLRFSKLSFSYNFKKT